MIDRIDPNDLMSQATVWNKTAYLAGQVALDNCDGDFPTQAKEVFSRIDAVLEKAGTDKSNLLAATIWLTDLGDFQAFNALWRDWIGSNGPPARATVQANLALPGLVIEVQVTAAIP